LGGFAIGALVVLLWQHNANPSYKFGYIPRYDDIMRTLGGVCVRCWPVTGGILVHDDNIRQHDRNSALVLGRALWHVNTIRVRVFLQTFWNHQ